MTGRYGQLTYTSFDRPGTAGGWQIQYTDADFTPLESERLLAGIRTSFVAEPPLGDFPTPEQLEAGPRRLAYRSWPDDAAAYWHTAPAGTDDTGRPGNVFAHVVLDRAATAAPVIRPIQRWRSPNWLRPYGAPAVSRAALPAAAPGPGAVVTKDSVIAFALDTTTWRLGTLLGLLDATAAALHGGPPVVLGAQSVESAAQWIGLISFLMSPGTATRLNFSTFDRADQLRAALDAEQHLTAVPLVDLPALAEWSSSGGPDVVVIDETAMLSLGELGAEPHRTAAGQPIVVTEWSVLAQEALMDPGSARRILDELDEHAAVADRALHPAWPLAVTIAAHSRFADAHREAHAVLAEHSSPGLRPDSKAGTVVAQSVSALLGTSTADAWAVVQRGFAGSVRDRAVATYLCRAVIDADWLDQLGPVPAPANYYRGQPVPEQLRATLDAAVEQATAAGPQRVLALAGLLGRAGVDDEQVVTALRKVVGSAVADPHSGAQLARRFAGERVGERTRVELATVALRLAGQRDGRSGLAQPVLDWLGAEVRMPSPGELQTAQPWDPTWTRAALCGARAEVSDTDDFARLWWSAMCQSPQRDRLAASRSWDPAQLLVAGAGALGTAAIPTLLAAPDSSELIALADQVLAGNADDAAVACAALRATGPAEWLARGYVDSHQRPYAQLWITGSASADLHEDAAVRIAVLCALGEVAGQRHPAELGTVTAHDAVRSRAADELVGLVQAGALGAHAVLAVGLLRSDDGAAVAEDGVDAALTLAAHRLAGTREYREDDEDAVVELMAKLADPADGGASPRRFRKMVHRMLARRTDGAPAPAARAWRTR